MRCSRRGAATAGPGSTARMGPCGPADVCSTIPPVRGPDRILPGSTPERRGMGERTRYEPGTFCLVGLAASDPPAATSFYARLFGWDAEELSAGEAGSYTILRRGGREVAILYRQTPQARAAGAPPHWTSYISVADADGTRRELNSPEGSFSEAPLKNVSFTTLLYVSPVQIGPW